LPHPLLLLLLLLAVFSLLLLLLRPLLMIPTGETGSATAYGC
jgi:hypothetical protein